MTEMTWEEKFYELYDEVIERFEEAKIEDAKGMMLAICAMARKADELERTPTDEKEYEDDE